MTRSSPRHNKSGKCHKLNFFYDTDNGCALTTLVHGFRFHIICDANRLKSQSNKGQHFENKYRKLIAAVREQGDEEEDGAEKGTVINGMEEELNAAEIHHQSDSQDSGVNISDVEATEGDDDRDSAVDVNDDTRGTRRKRVNFADADEDLTEEELHDPEMAMQNWMLAPFAEIFETLEHASDDESEQQTLKAWYSGPTYFYQLEIKEDELTPIEIKSQPDLEQRIAELVPHIHVPKYITEMDVPWFKSDDLVVISESDEPDPYHPSRVKVGSDVYFFKLVDATQPQPVKRELKILNDIEKKGLHEKFRVPRLRGFVGFEDSKTEITGFLLTEIEDPTPLTIMLDSDVIEDKRDKWAKESKKIVKILHENNIVWGDAKADNFMIDKHGELWIIDFGGSYTDGWVDPELMETREGDKMGVDKIVKALEDPEANTYDPAEEDENDGKQDVASGKKRSREVAEEGEDNEAKPSSKKQRSDS